MQAVTCKLPHEDRSNIPIASTLTTLSVASTFVLLRLVSKVWVRSSRLRFDDGIIALALVSRQADALVL